MDYTYWPRQSMAVALSFLLVSFETGLYAQQPPPGGYDPLDAQQLNQLVAPIALYPDSLVAQVLTASTFADQVKDADGWIHRYSNMPPDQLAAAADATPWDPSVKALTVFPSVLDNMARNYGWTAALGNAYYNQPGDVMNAVQAMRYQAQQAGTLRNTPQQRVVYEGGLVMIEPVNAGMVYVPYYDPWAVYGAPIGPWGGYYWGGPPRGVALGAGIAIGFGVGIGVGVFAHYGWGYHAWSPNWHGGVVVYNNTTYISHSTTVINRGQFGGYNRGVYERPGAGVPAGYRPAVTSQTAVFPHPEAGAGRPAPGQGYRPAPGVENRPGAQPAYRAPANENRPAAQPAYRAPANENRPAAQPAYRAPANENRPAMPQVSHAPAPNQPAPKAPAKAKAPAHSEEKPEHHEK